MALQQYESLHKRKFKKKMGNLFKTFGKVRLNMFWATPCMME